LGNQSAARNCYYKIYLEKFLQFTNISDTLIKQEPKKLEFPLIEYVSHLKKFVELCKISPNGFPTIFAPLETFFVQKDVLINFKKIKRACFPEKSRQRESIRTQESIWIFAGRLFY